MNKYDVIKKPLFTEKGTYLKEKENKILVEVDRGANKIQIRDAVERIFDVKVSSVRIVNVRPKKKMQGRQEGTTSARKKAIITLRKGEKLDFIEGV